jgi:hypothetical protein
VDSRPAANDRRSIRRPDRELRHTAIDHLFGHPLADVQRQMAASEAVFSAYRSYVGIAIHDAVGYRAIVDAAR